MYSFKKIISIFTDSIEYIDNVDIMDCVFSSAYEMCGECNEKFRSITPKKLITEIEDLWIEYFYTHDKIFYEGYLLAIKNAENYSKIMN
jgi:hypothetical protein